MLHNLAFTIFAGSDSDTDLIVSQRTVLYETDSPVEEQQSEEQNFGKRKKGLKGSIFGLRSTQFRVKYMKKREDK
jgi:hypothetical protein